MTNINLLINSAQFIISLLDLKQQLLTGTFNSNSFFGQDKNRPPAKEPRLSKEIHDESSYYRNPVIKTNLPGNQSVNVNIGSQIMDLLQLLRAFNIVMLWVICGLWFLH